MKKLEILEFQSYVDDIVAVNHDAITYALASYDCKNTDDKTHSSDRERISQWVKWIAQETPTDLRKMINSLGKSLREYVSSTNIGLVFEIHNLLRSENICNRDSIGIVKVEGAKNCLIEQYASNCLISALIGYYDVLFDIENQLIMQRADDESFSDDELVRFKENNIACSLIKQYPSVFNYEDICHRLSYTYHANESAFVEKGEQENPCFHTFHTEYVPIGGKNHILMLIRNKDSICPYSNESNPMYIRRNEIESISSFFSNMTQRLNNYGFHITYREIKI